MAAGASAEVKVTVTPIGDRPETTKQTDRKVTTAEILVNEDFSGFTAGTEAAPDYDNCLASNLQGNLLINPDLTNGRQWMGNFVYSAGGAVALSTTNAYNPAFLMTPQMDYSGSVKLKFNVKYEYVEFDNGTGQMSHWTGSSCYVYIVNSTDDEFQLEGARQELANIRLYQNQGWYEVEVEFDNYSAYNDASIEFLTGEAVLIDNVYITSSVDNFIAAPTDLEIFDVTETSFSIKFDPVRKAFNYYTYLYTVTGYDEAGEPIYFPVCPPDIEADLELYEMTWEEYVEMVFEGDIFDPYCNYGKIDEFKPTVYTFENLDPSTDYYFGVRSHYVSQFSTLEIFPANVIAAPKVLDATVIGKDNFTANWTPIQKADTYEVTLYGTSRAEENTDEYIVFEENFSNLSAYSETDNIYDPTVLDNTSGITLDDLTTVPGWITNMKKFYITETGFGLKGFNPQAGTPMIDVSNDDSVILTLRAKATQEQGTFRIGFGNEVYEMEFTQADFEGDIVLPTNGMDECRLVIAGDGESDLFIEYIAVSQSVKAGDYIYYYLGTETVPKDETSYEFSGLDIDNYDMFSYSVQAVKGEGLSRIVSAPSEKMIVDLVNGSSMVGVSGIQISGEPAEVFEVERYTIDGRRIDEPQKGLNIVKFSDGSVKKVFVK